MPAKDRPTERREFGRDGISGLVDVQRALRAREVSRPTNEQLDAARTAAEQLLRRAQGRR